MLMTPSNFYNLFGVVIRDIGDKLHQQGNSLKGKSSKVWRGTQ